MCSRQTSSKNVAYSGSRGVGFQGGTSGLRPPWLRSKDIVRSSDLLLPQSAASPPPFSGMNSTLADSRADRSTATVAGIGTVFLASNRLRRKLGEVGANGASFPSAPNREQGCESCPRLPPPIPHPSDVSALKFSVAAVTAGTTAPMLAGAATTRPDPDAELVALVDRIITYDLPEPTTLRAFAMFRAAPAMALKPRMASPWTPGLPC